jgi:hypothetical protein
MKTSIDITWQLLANTLVLVLALIEELWAMALALVEDDHNYGSSDKYLWI